MTIFTRSALVFWGHNPAPDVARVEIDWRGERRVVTWADVMHERREWQRRILERKRYVEPWRAHKLWVAYFDQNLFGGWQAFLEDFRGRNGRRWIDRDAPGLQKTLMELFPMSLPFGDAREQWEGWKPLFAHRFKRRMQDHKPLGVAYVWVRRSDVRKVEAHV